jgi:hypothetical protein
MATKFGGMREAARSVGNSIAETARNPSSLGRRMREGAESLVKDENGAAVQAAEALKNVKKKREDEAGLACGGTVKKYAKGGSVDGIASRGKTRGKVC